MSKRSKRDTLYAAARARYVYPKVWTGVAAGGSGAVAAGAALMGDPALAWTIAGGGLTAAAAGVPWWVGRHVMPKGTSAGMLRRKSLDAQRTHGTAGRLDVMQYGSATAVKLKGRWTRPETFGKATNMQLRMADATEFGVPLLELGQGWGWAGEQVWASVEDTTLRIGGPRTYKTLSLVCHGLDAKGAVVTTSTRLDVAEWLHLARCARRVPKVPGGPGWAPEDYDVEVITAGTSTGAQTHHAVCHDLGCGWETGKSVNARSVNRKTQAHRAMHAKRKWTTIDRPVHFFNPAGYVNVESTVRWSILHGCEDYRTARRRAADLIPETPDADGERWDRQARRILALFLHAAARGKDESGQPYRGVDVLRWAGISRKDDPARLEVIDALNRGGKGGEVRAAEARAHWENNEKTLTSITTTMMPALTWLSDDRARAIGDADLETVTLDVERLIREGETLHLIGHEDQSGLAPLIGCVVSEIAHQARQLAGHSPGQRLDPPLTFLLDEAALVCQVPLDRWTADMGGRGVSIHVSVQSFAQLRQRWGKDGAGTILGNVGWLLIFGGNKNADDLADASLLSGEHQQKVLDPDVEAENKRWKPVMTPADITRMPAGEALLLPRGMLCLVGRTPLVVDRGVRQISLTGYVPVSRRRAVELLPQQKQAEEAA